MIQKLHQLLYGDLSLREDYHLIILLCQDHCELIGREFFRKE